MNIGNELEDPTRSCLTCLTSDLKDIDIRTRRSEKKSGWACILCGDLK